MFTYGVSCSIGKVLITMGFQENLRKFREAQGITAKDFAAKVGLKYGTYFSYETAGKEPKLETLCKIAAALHVSIDELLGYDYSPTDKNISLCRDLGVTAAKGDGFVDVPAYNLDGLAPDVFNAFVEYAHEKALPSAAPHFQALIESDFDYFQLLYSLLNDKGFSVSAGTLAQGFDYIKAFRRQGAFLNLSAAERAEKIVEILKAHGLYPVE